MKMVERQQKGKTVKIDIISGFLGVGKTTLIKKLIPAYGEKIVVIENEFGAVNIDSDLFPADVSVREIYAGCICCSLASAFKRTIEDLMQLPDLQRIVIEPSGVGQFTEILKLCRVIEKNKPWTLLPDHLVTIVNGCAFDECVDDFGTFYLDQIQHCGVIFLSHIEDMPTHELRRLAGRLRQYNPGARIFLEDWTRLSGEALLACIDGANGKSADVSSMTPPPAAGIIDVCTLTQPAVVSEKRLTEILEELRNVSYGKVLRAKGFLRLEDKKTAHFDFVPYHTTWSIIDTEKENRAVVIGCQLNKDKIQHLFGQRS